MKIKIIGMTRNQHRSKYTKMTFYVSNQERPINKGNFLEDFAWRREHQEPIKAKELQPYLYFIVDMFIKHNLREELKLSYSKYAGCQMCPCSPGYVLKTKDQGYENLEFWIEVEQ